MEYEGIARPYARALFDLGKELGCLPQMTREVAEFADLYGSNAELSLVVEDPLVPEASREAVLAEVAARMGISETTRNALRLLVRKRRMRALPQIAAALARHADEAAGVVRAVVTSAVPLSEAYVAKLRTELEKSTRQKVILTQKQDPSLIGGIVTQIGDKVIDGSVRARLAGLRDSILRN